MIELKAELLRLVVETAGASDYDRDALLARASQPHISLEVFVSMLGYRCGAAFRPAELWRGLCERAPVNRLTWAIARLRTAGLVGTVLTTNFDQLVPRALETLGAREGHEFRFLTEWQLQPATAATPTTRDVCALHGTVYRLDAGEFAPPITATARGLARPFPPAMRRYLASLLQAEQRVLVIGYSGQDHYDVNPLLDEVRGVDPDALRHWLWISHPYAGPTERERVSRIVGGERHLVADATNVLAMLCARLGLDIPVADSGQNHTGANGWRGDLARAFRELRLPREGARQFLTDLRQNVPGTWVVLEHYRLFSAGYDEAVALTFGGLTRPTAAPSGEVGAEHLAYLQPPWKVPFGDLLHAQFWYRQEDREIAHRDGPGDIVLYPRSARLLCFVRERIAHVLAYAPSGALRPEDRALLLIGLAIAEDYLGLIERKRGIRRPAQRATHWVNARRHFAACRSRAQAAAEILTKPASDIRIDRFADDLVQHRVWTLIGQANLARTLDDRTEATAAFVEVIALMQKEIEHERLRANSHQERGFANDYLIALYPQLWLRASELLKVILDCQEDAATPCGWDRLDQTERELAEHALEVCEDAYIHYTRRTSVVNSRFPARYEAVLIAFAARAMGSSSLSLAHRQAALDRLRRTVQDFSVMTDRHPNVRPDWVANVRRRIAGLWRALPPDLTAA